MRGRFLSRLLAVAVGTTALTGMLSAAPAVACGCGGVVPPANTTVSVSDETSLLGWDGRSEEITMQLGMHSTARDVALILPVPAKATTSLGDAKVFTQLAAITAPKIIYDHRPAPTDSDGNGAGAPGGGAPPVKVIEQKNLGPFVVTQLAATDPTALSTWLRTHGYHLKPEFAAAVTPYVHQRWVYLAARLRAASGSDLSGALTPLRITFPSAKFVYPMRLSALATVHENVTLYVLAEHRVARSDANSALTSATAYAGRIDPASVKGTALATYVTHRRFLTKLTTSLPPDTAFTEDFSFAYTTDTAYRQVEHRTVYDLPSSDAPKSTDAQVPSGSGRAGSESGLPAGAWAGIGVGIALILGIAGAARLGSRRGR